VNPQFEFDLSGMFLTLFAHKPEGSDAGDNTRLGTLVFTDEAGDRPDLLKAFLAANPNLKPVKGGQL